MPEQPEVSVILPVYNQSDHITQVVEAYRSVLDRLKHSFEIILVVNASRDGSLEVCRRLAAASTQVRVLHGEAPGWGRAVRDGISAARGQLIAYANSARTSPYTLGLLVMLALANPGCILKANRRLRYPFLRRLGSLLYNLECRTLFGLAVWDVNGTPKVFNRDLISALDLREDGDLIDLEFVVKCRQLNLQVLEVPIVSAARHGGDSTTGVASALKLYDGALRLWLAMRRSIPADDERTGA